MKKSITCILLAAALLAGCSGMRIVDSDVAAFSAPATGALSPPASYRFERLPSQQGQSRDALESLVAVELAKVNLRLDNTAPQYSVQVNLRMFRDPLPPWYDPRYTNGYFRPYAVASPYGGMLRFPPTLSHFEYPYYRRDIGLVMRRLATGEVVYETRAKHDGPWPDDAAVLPAMLQSALRDFPNPPPGLRRIVVEIPR